ncbi:MAG: Gluconolactonase [Planctomycetaceae bacterium]|nr:Gluconolactonase [Planctomycetaceae bacterium]
MPTVLVRLSVLMLVMLSAVSVQGELPKPTGDTIVAPDAKLELLFTRTANIKGGLTEGPTAGPDGCIYFSDIPFGPDKGMIMKFDPKTSKTSVFVADSMKSNGLKIDHHGHLFACEGSDEGGRAVVRYDLKTPVRKVIADRYNGKKFNAPNDLVLDSHGRIYFSDPKYLGTEKRELEHRAVYRVDQDGTVIEITHEVEKPNGVALSPDGKALYVADHNNGTDQIGSTEVAKPGAMKVYAFPLGADGKVAGARKTLYDFGKQAGCDGMTVDSQGHIYLTSRGLNRPGVLVLSPAGKEMAFIPTGLSQPEGTKDPIGLPSNVTFGIGDASKTLYITVDKSLYRIPLKAEGFRQHAMK